MNDANRNTGATRASDQLHGATDRVAEKATDAITSAKSAVHHTVSAVADRTNAATQWASRKVDAARDAPSALADSGADYIKASPYLAIGLAVAVGYLLGRARR